MQEGREAVAHEGSGVDPPADDPGLQLAPQTLGQLHRE